MNSRPFYLVVFIFLCASCQKQELSKEEREEVYGEWEWKSSSGGWAWRTWGPESEGYEESLTISRNRIKHFRNDELRWSARYENRYEENLDRNVLIIRKQLDYSYHITNDSLHLLAYDCADCASHLYVKK